MEDNTNSERNDEIPEKIENPDKVHVVKKIDTGSIGTLVISPTIRKRTDSSGESSARNKENTENTVKEEIEKDDLDQNNPTENVEKNKLAPKNLSPTPSMDSIADDEIGMNYAVMKERRWADFYPRSAKNQFIKKVFEAVSVGNEKFPQQKKKQLEKMKESTSLSVFKFDQSFVELFLIELSSTEVINKEDSFQKMIEDYVASLQDTDFEEICLDFKKFINSCLVFLVRSKHSQPICLRKFLEWFFFNLFHNSEFIKGQWALWVKEMKDAYDNTINVYMNEALIEACIEGKHEMVFEFLRNGFEISDTDFKDCIVGKKESKKRVKENQFNQRHLKMFRAKSTPSYLLANFCYCYKKFEAENGKKPTTFKNIKKEDPFSVTLHNVKIAKNMSVDEYDLAEYVKHLKNIIDEGREFLGDLISLCKNLDEAKLLLSHDSMLDHYELKHDLTDWEYGRLDEACLSSHMKMVTNDYSQRIFKDAFCGSNNEWSLKISGILWVDSIVQILYATVLCPAHLILYLFAYLPCKRFGFLGYLKSKLTGYHPFIQSLFFHYSVPQNRCSSAIVCHIALICLIIITMKNPSDEPKKLDIDWYDVCLVLWTFGCLVKYSFEALYFAKHFFSYGKKEKKKSKRTHWRRSIRSIKDIYNLLQFLCCAFILLGKLFKFIGFLKCAQKSPENQIPTMSFPHLIFLECEEDDPQGYRDNSYLKTGYSLIGVGSTICILNLLHWFELNSKLGPIIVSLQKTFSDILKILATFVVFLFAFAVGLHFSLRLSNMYCQDEIAKIQARTDARNEDHLQNCNIETIEANQTGLIIEDRNESHAQNCYMKTIETNLTGFTLEDNVNHFRTFQESMKTCFWSLFDPGHPEVIGCTQVIILSF